MLTLRFASGEPVPTDRAGRLVNTWRDDAGRTQASAFALGDLGWIDWPRLGVFAFRTGSTVVDVAAAGGVPRDIIEATFVQSLQPVILQALGWQALHASAVATGSGVIAVCGRRGSGKSTLAAALASAGNPQIADDAVVFECRDDRVRVQPLPFAPQLSPSAREFLATQPPARTTAATTLEPSDSVNLLKSVFVLSNDEAGDSAPALRHLSAVEAFSALLAHAHCFDEADRRHTAALVESYMTVAARVPVFALARPARFDRLPEVVAAILGTERRRHAALFPGGR
jgi:hypothetical protein